MTIPRLHCRLTGYLAGLLLACAVAAMGQPAGRDANASPQTSPGAPNRTGVPPAAQRGKRGTRRNPPPQQPGGANTSGTGSSGQAAQATSGPATSAPGSAGIPAAVFTGKVYMEGQGDRDRQASDDKPLLPIAQQSDSLGIRSGTPIRVRLRQPVDSAHAKNGDELDAVLAEPVGSLPAGTPVQLTVVLALRAGTINSYGELSLQVVSMANHRILSEIVTALGKEGTKELPDAAPSLGTDAGFTVDQVITLNAA